MILRYSLTSSDRLIADDKGIQYLASQWDRTGIYMELQPLLNAGRASLSDQPELLRELRGPEPAPWSSWNRSHRPDSGSRCELRTRFQASQSVQPPIRPRLMNIVDFFDPNKLQWLDSLSKNPYSSCVATRT